jgi:hypothetical protein
MIRGSYRMTQSRQPGETNKSACAARLRVCSASLGVVAVGLMRSLCERGVALSG